MCNAGYNIYGNIKKPLPFPLVLFSMITYLIPEMKALFSSVSLFLGSGRLMEYLMMEEPIVDAKIAGFAPLPAT